MTEPGRHIKVGLIGVGGSGAEVLDALLACPGVELVAIADRDTKLTDSKAHTLGIRGYDDSRSMMIEQPLEALFVTAPPHACGEILRLAASRRLPVWKQTPLARRFEQAIRLTQWFEQAGCPLVVAGGWRFEPAFRAVQGKIEQLGRFFLGRADVATCWPEQLGWRGDNERAGGGAILHVAYEAIDAVVALMGVPQEVLAATSRSARPDVAHAYDTEDTCVVVCRYAEAAAAVTGCWSASPEGQTMSFHGPGGSLFFDATGVTIRSPQGRKIARRLRKSSNIYSAQIEAFVAGVVAGEPLSSTAPEHLSAMAVVEAAYLSARTGEPESPDRLFRLEGLIAGQVPSPW